MRLLLLNYSLHAQGGSQMTSLALAEALSARGHRVIFGAMRGPLVARLERASIPFVDLPFDPAHPDLHTLNVGNIHRIKKILRDERIELVHAFQYFPAIAAVAAAAWRPVPVVLSLLGPNIPVTSLPPRIAHVFVVSEELREKVLGRRYVDPRRLTVLPNRIDLTRYRATPKVTAGGASPAFPGSDRRVAIVSTLTDPKYTALRTFVAAAERIAERRRDVQFLIAGDGPRRASLQAEVDAAHARVGREVLTLVGIVDIPNALPHLDVVVGMGRSALEALAAGRPTVMLGPTGIATAVGARTVRMLGYSNFTGRGLEIPSEPARALQEAIEQQLDDPEASHWSETEGRAFVLAEYDAETGARILETVYAGVLPEPRGARVVRIIELAGFVARAGLELLARRARLRGRAIPRHGT